MDNARITPHIVMDHPNDSITLYEGGFLLRNHTEDIKVNNGQIKVICGKWMRVMFYGEIERKPNTDASWNFDLIIDNKLCGRATITIVKYECGASYIHGTCVYFTAGNREQELDYVQFAVTNLNSGLGEKTTVRGGYHSDRWTFEDEVYEIILEKRTDNADISNQLKAMDGGIVLPITE